MGDTPSGVVARRMWPSSVASFGRVTHAPADPRALSRASDEHYYISLGGAREPQSGFPDGAGRGGRLAGRALVNNLGTFATIEGSGFGMTKNEHVKGVLGAHECWRRHLRQFGVGFLSAYLIRTRFASTARTMKMNSTSGVRSVTPSPCRTTPRMIHVEVKRGTKIIFYLRRTSPSSWRYDA